MTTPPPIRDTVIDNNGLPTLPWTLFFNSTFQGDSGTEWLPNIVNLTGGATLTGRYYQISQYLTYNTITITPDSSTSSTSGSTYIDNFPLQMAGDGFCISVAGTSGGSIGVCDSSSNRIYTPTWSSVGVPVTILCICEAR